MKLTPSSPDLVVEDVCRGNNFQPYADTVYLASSVNTYGHISGSGH